MPEIPGRIKQLIETFSRNIDTYKKGDMNETQLRREYLDPFFTELGWDVENKRGYADAYKDVIHEYSLKTKDVREAPDYCFRIGGTRKFFLEAKKPSVNVKEDIHPAFQVRSYAWSAKLPLSILTDFEEFAVYDCRIPPHKNDKASTARVMYFTYDQYIEKWEEITEIFSREAILKGSFDKYIESNKKKKGTAEVDSVFLDQMEEWRKLVARNIALRNPSLSIRELNFVVQKTIDRIIFLRICEDRGIEDYGQLMALQNGANVYDRLKGIYDRADEKYNSGLFHFTEEKERGEAPDSLSHNLTIDDKVLKDIFKQLYYPDSPYEFSVLPADILGQVYEQFLGKIIRLTPTHQAVIEDKPEVKKAGGVYYTPTYIVDYIVQNTVGKLLQDKKLKDAAKIRILDPACGSGSFLIGAFQYLLNWHLGQYTGDDEAIKKYSTQKQPAIYQASNGDWLLTTYEKRRILLNSIYGVDIDSQAVEVTKLSLLLKVLEGESEQTISNQLKFFRERALPDLSNNIKCGNSLIGPDFYNQMEMNFLDDEEKLRINVFDWKKEFPEIFSSHHSAQSHPGLDPGSASASESSGPDHRSPGVGGFDVVIGNPPWGSLFKAEEKKYLNNIYVNKKGEAESHLYFIEKSIGLLSQIGFLGFITPNTWLSIRNSSQTRNYILSKAKINEIIELTKYVFKDAPDIVPIIILLSQYSSGNDYVLVKRTDLKKITADNFKTCLRQDFIDQNQWATNRDNVINLRLTKRTISILKKCHIKSQPLKNVAKVIYGIKTGDNKKYLSNNKENEDYKKALKTGELSRYSLIWKGYYLCWNNKLAGYRESSVDIPKIIIQYIRKLSLGRRIIAALDIQGLYYPLNNYSYILTTNSEYSLKFLIGVINSTLINFYFANTFIDYNIKPLYLQQIPIKQLADDNIDVEITKKIENYVDKIIALNDNIKNLKTPAEKTAFQRQIFATDKQIDQLVYQLYGLTEEEIKIVEGE